MQVLLSNSSLKLSYVMINNADGGDFAEVLCLYSREENYWYLDYVYWLHWIPITSNSKGYRKHSSVFKPFPCSFLLQRRWLYRGKVNLAADSKPRREARPHCGFIHCLKGCFNKDSGTLNTHLSSPGFLSSTWISFRQEPWNCLSLREVWIP